MWDMFALSVADSVGATTIVDDGAKVKEEEKEVASDAFRSIALIFNREQVSISSKQASLHFEFFSLFLFPFSLFLDLPFHSHMLPCLMVFCFCFPGFRLCYEL
jgi:hypothetical protein